jgi:hypothetical protein
VTEQGTCAASMLQHTPMYRITAGNSNWNKIKRLAMASILMKATGG